MEKRRIALAAIAAILSSTLISGSIAHADTPSVPRVLDVQLSETAVTVAGLATHDMTVRLHLASYIGIIESPAVALTRTTPGLGQVDDAPQGSLYTLVSGNAEDGWWEGIVHLTAGYDGIFSVTRVWANQSDGSQVDVDPRTLGVDAHVQVTGVDIPHLTITQSPAIVTTGHLLTLSGVVTAADSGLPLAGAPVSIGYDTACVEGGYGGPPALSDAAGAWHVTDQHWSWNGALSCSYIAKWGTAGAGSAEVVYASLGRVVVNYREAVSARLASRTVRVGGKVRVSGLTWSPGATVALQRLVGRRWRTVGTAVVRDDAHFTLTAQPPTRGVHYYRVWLAATRSHEFASSSSGLRLVAR